MAQFDYATYSAQREASRNNSTSGYRGDGPQVQFLNALIKRDGDYVVVRFPYHSMADVKLETCHSVTFPGDKYSKRVRCSGVDCPLCMDAVKLETRFFAKMLVYTEDGKGGVDILPAVWDRPAAFADIDLKNLIADYGDLAGHLFKIKRNGTGLDTRYTISYIANATTYPESVYKADFSSLESIDPVKILTRPLEKYLEAIGQAPATPAPTAKVEVEPVRESVTPVANTYVREEAPAAAPVAPAAPTYSRPSYTTTPEVAAARPARPTRYYNPGE